MNFKLPRYNLFHDINLKNNGAIVNLRFSSICGQVRTSFGDKGEKFTGGYNWIHLMIYLIAFDLIEVVLKKPFYKIVTLIDRHLMNVLRIWLEILT